MASVVLSAFNVAGFPEGGGHFWVYMQYALGLKQLGCDVTWLERFVRTGDNARDSLALGTFFERIKGFGMEGRVALISGPDPKRFPDAPTEVLGMTESALDQVIGRADLLLNFHYAIDPRLLVRFRRTALVDIDPGLLQFWISRGQLTMPPHDHYFTTGETVGTPGALFPDCGIDWVHIRPVVCLERWPAQSQSEGAMTTVSAWDGGDWVVDGESAYENTKRMSFLAFKELPQRTRQPLELALFLRTAADAQDRQVMEGHGWRIRPSREVAGTPGAYQEYIQSARGEFSCAKPSCMRFQNAWVSDRTVCYLASGKPAVVQNTGPSGYLPNGQGLFRFSTLEEAAAALEAVNADYPRHSRAARALAEAHFDARKGIARILGVALG